MLDHLLEQAQWCDAAAHSHRWLWAMLRKVLVDETVIEHRYMNIYIYGTHIYIYIIIYIYTYTYTYIYIYRERETLIGLGHQGSTSLHTNLDIG